MSVISMVPSLTKVPTLLPTLAPLAVTSVLAFFLSSFLSFLRLSLISPLLALLAASRASRDCGSSSSYPLSFLNRCSFSAILVRRSLILAAGGRAASAGSAGGSSSSAAAAVGRLEGSSWRQYSPPMHPTLTSRNLLLLSLCSLISSPVLRFLFFIHRLSASSCVGAT